jgi:hypothetical protein
MEFMKEVVVLVLVFLLAAPVVAFDEPYGGVKLLDGYRFKRSSSVDTINGLIYKEGGLSIEFESGISEGYAVDLKNKSKYIWCRDQMVNGHKVMLALTKSGVGTVWKPERARSSKPGNILIVTFPGRFGPNDAANFYAEVLSEQEIADMLLMVLTFDPTK